MTPVPSADVRRGDGRDFADFAGCYCRVTKDSIGGAAGAPMLLRPWQVQLVGRLLARSRGGRLRHRQALIGMARKNGKSALGASLALFELIFGPSGGEVYSIAAEKEQARIVFGTARRMVELDPELSTRLKLYRDVIEEPSTGSIYRVLSAEAYSKEGLNPHFVIADEVHAQPNRDLWDTLALASGARLEPLMLGITTAGVRTDQTGRDSLCYGMYQYGRRVASGEVEDPSFFMAWWEPSDPEADHRDSRVQRQANPGFGDLVAEADFASAVLRTPEAEFRTKRCNQWVATSAAWLPHGVWSRCADPRRIPELAEVVLGFDGSFSNDSTALVAVEVGVVPHVDVVEAWERPAGEDTGWRVPVLDVEAAIRAACRRWRVRAVACDPFRWARSYQVLEGEGLPIVEFPQAQPLDEPVLTPTGWRAMKELAAGDEVIGSDGQPTTVTATHDRGVKPVYEVAFTDGAATRCTGDHLWLTANATQRRKGSPGTVRTLDEIAALGLRNSTGRASLRFVPMVGAVEYEPAELPVDPYVLGVLLGDGSFSGRSTPRFTSIDDGIVDRVRERLPHGVRLVTHGQSRVHYSLSGAPGAGRNPMTEALRELGLYGLDGAGKHIPAAYLTASAEQRLDLLRGLMDTDGTAAANGAASFHTTSPGLRDGLVAVTRSLGGTARVSPKPIAGKMRRPAWTLSISLPPGVSPFALTRKTARVDRKVSPHRAMSSVTAIGEMAVRCITVANPDGLYVTNDYLVTHNSPARMTPATQRFYEAVVNGQLTHSGDPRLGRHMDNCVLRVDARGSRLAKETKSSPRKIDLAVAAVMAVEVAATAVPEVDVAASVW